ncbi:MAG: hypothetical protein ACTSV5_11140 [Promethearchaeota archaeon]
MKKRKIILKNKESKQQKKQTFPIWYPTLTSWIQRGIEFKLSQTQGFLKDKIV